jgi:hypothetical protein
LCLLLAKNLSENWLKTPVPGKELAGDVGAHRVKGIGHQGIDQICLSKPAAITSIVMEVRGIVKTGFGGKLGMLRASAVKSNSGLLLVPSGRSPPSFNWGTRALLRNGSVYASPVATPLHRGFAKG